LDGLLLSLVQLQTKKHWHLYRKSASHKRGLDAQLEEMFGAMLVLPQALLRLLRGLNSFYTNANAFLFEVAPN
jgi:hypothetical protein